ncbi:bifunctional 2-polyprenyl-6-hydroxyphenol methylase/3-demethylubiquinol 3-O-methyltransferase UbiG [Magnetospirillum sp. UT-4]|uniref:class I SAM-dependent methyltransferase n=1 Tax=Magnetospirillum sp. UT-4 TaxID=2681467 RepID=UPI00138448CF|nr:class I SAM-dependent methyltransferase [Magnetospirillum sp. UT-4]CAA7621772.1 putative Methyltransferase type 11 [Magnetospirillum sp. UT-4]
MTTLPLFSDRILPLLKAPGKGDDTTIAVTADGLRCPETGEAFPLLRGIPSLYHPSPEEGADVTARIRSFYEETPFPSYEGLEEYGELVSKGLSNPFSRQLLDAIGHNKTVLECGCGTGQMSNFLQLNNNHVLGIDLSLASLGLAVEHKTRNQLTRPGFCQMNIFELAIKDSSFDVVISHGVLHHTFDARRAFASIVKKCKPGGFVMVGLYNMPSRFPTWMRSKLIRLLGPKIDYVVRNRIRDARKAEVWIKDQYFNPHETWHSIDEVLGWFDENGIEYLNCSPAILDSAGEDAPGLFDKTDPGTRWSRFVTQMSWLGTIAREGALFDVIGRKAA